jgi:four helix bundle protein
LFDVRSPKTVNIHRLSFAEHGAAIAERRMQRRKTRTSTQNPLRSQTCCVADSSDDMGTIVSFRDLDAWKLAMRLAESVYKGTEGFPAAERYGLRSQIRRAAVSIPSNVAEGHARKGRAFLNHVRIALGSGAELGTEIELALRLGFLDRDRAIALLGDIKQVRQVLSGLKRSLERDTKTDAVSLVVSTVAIISLAASALS